MKVVHVIARVNRGGTAEWLRNLIIPMRESGHEHILLAGDVEENELEDLLFEEVSGIRIKNLKRSISIVPDFLAILKVRKILKIESPNILNTHTAKGGLIGRTAAIGLGIKVVHTYHGHLIYGYFSKNKAKIFLQIEKILARVTIKFIAVGSQVKIDLIKRGIGSEEEFKVIRPGLPMLSFSTISEAKQKFGIDPDKKCVGWLGRMTSIKRPDRLVELARSNPELLFLAGGDGELLSTLAANCPDNLKFLGWVSPEQFWPACDIAILTSDNEGLPTSLIEAAQFGLPIVALNVGSVSDIVIDGKTGILAEKPDQLQDKLNILINSRDMQELFSVNAKAHILSNFNLKNFLRDHLEVYEGLLVNGK